MMLPHTVGLQYNADVTSQLVVYHDDTKSERGIAIVAARRIRPPLQNAEKRESHHTTRARVELGSAENKTGKDSKGAWEVCACNAPCPRGLHKHRKRQTAPTPKRISTCKITVLVSKEPLTFMSGGKWRQGPSQVWRRVHAEVAHRQYAEHTVQ